MYIFCFFFSLTYSSYLVTYVHQNILDIGAYYNPINLFLNELACPASFIVVEPILNALSVIVPCKGSGQTHFIFLPITFKYYLKIKSQLPVSDSIVCIGCDSHYGPNRYLLETSFNKPYKLFLEYPADYVHNAAFKKMNGQGKLWNLCIHNFHYCSFIFIFPSYLILIIQKSK